jgi:hypothetical protein
MSEDAMLVRFREKDSREGISRATMRRIAAALDLSETAAIHRALVEFAQRYVPRYEQDNGEITEAQRERIAGLVRARHGKAVIVESLFETPKPEPRLAPNVRKRVSASRPR